jgi:phage shock protein A
VGFFNSVKQWFSSEAAEAKESATAAKTRMEAAMDRREADLSATPVQKLEQIKSEIGADPFAEVRDKIDAQQAQADAVDELSQPARGSTDDSALAEDSGPKPGAQA